MDDTPSGRCYKRPESKHGDVDIHGDLVDELVGRIDYRLTERLNAAVGDCVGFSREQQVANVRADVARIRRARGLA